MRCDRISLMNAGKVLACDAPQKLIEARGAASLEDAFIGYMEDAIADAAHGGESKDKAPAARPRPDSLTSQPTPSQAAAQVWLAPRSHARLQRTMKPCRSCAIRCDWPSPSSAPPC